MEIYFDNAATTKPITPPSFEEWGNPSSPHIKGIEAERKLVAARRELAKILGCAQEEVVLTSGGTESNNLAIVGLALANKRKGITFLASHSEHPSVLEPLKFIQSQGWGNVCISDYKQWPEVCDNHSHLVVATTHVHHETGDIIPIKNFRQKYPGATILVDGAQGFCKEEIPDADIYTFSGHKIHGPAGCGGMKIKRGIRIIPLLHGGGQEGKLRPGTENLQGVLHMTHAATAQNSNRLKNHEHVSQIKQVLCRLKGSINHVGETSPYILNMSFLGIKGEILVHALAEKGLYVSMGAACNSKKNAGSTLESMGFTKELASSAIRLSFSATNTIEEAKKAKEIISNTVYKLQNLLNGM